MSGVTLNELLKHVGLTDKQLDEECTHEHLRDIALFLTSWRTLAPQLELSSEVEAIEKDAHSEKERMQKFLEAWKAKFAFKATYRVLVEALLKIGSADQAQQVCGSLVSQQPKAHKGSAQLSQEGDVEDSCYYLESDASHIQPNRQSSNTSQPASEKAPFGCGCGRCTYFSFFERGCPTPIPSASSFPYLDLNGLTSEEQQALRGRLQYESEKIMRLFQELVSSTIQSIKEQQIPLSDLVSHIMTLGALGPVYKQKPQVPAFHHYLEDLRNADTVSKVFIALADHLSFFNYHVIEHIITRLGTQEDKDNLKHYKDKFDQYARRRIFECMPQFGPVSETKHADVFVKVDSQYENFTVNAVEKFRCQLSELLHVSPQGILRLCHIEKGCFQLTFQMPLFVQQTVFPLSGEQESELAEMGVIRLMCGKYEFQTEYGGGTADGHSTSVSQSSQSDGHTTPVDQSSQSDGHTTPVNQSSQADGHTTPVGRSSQAGGEILSENALMKGLSKFPHSKWHELGVELKVPGATLKSIENNYMQRGGVERCFSETMEWWYKNNPGATWGKICAALQAIHEEALARQVAKDHGCSPVIFKQLESVNVNLGEKNVTFKCEAAGTPPLQYSWKFNGCMMNGETENILKISYVNTKVEGTYLCIVSNSYDHITSDPAELRIGKEVTEDSMCDLLIRSGVQAADWLVIAKELKLTTQMLAGAFLKAWKESDYTRPSWEKLAKALRAIGEGWYESASHQAERNAGHELTAEKMCEMFKEAKIEEPNWLEVSSKLGIVLYGQVSSTELYQAWCKRGPSWNKLFQALQKFDGYQQVAKQAKKKAGLELKADNVRQVLSEAGIEAPDWKRIGEQLGLQLRGHITASTFFEGWQAHESEMSWKRLAQALERIEGYEKVAKKAKEKTGQKLDAEAMCNLLTETGICSPNWEKIGNQLGLQLEGHLSTADFFDEWRANDRETSWMKLATALAKIQEYQHAESIFLEKQVQEINEHSMVATFIEAGCEVPEDWREIGVQLGLNLRGKLSPAEFFKGWRENSFGNKPSWVNLADALHKMEGYQHVAILARKKEPAEMSESNICSLFRDIDDVDWALIGRKLYPTQVLMNDNCLKHALKRWHNKMKGNPWTTWRKLAVVVGNIYGSKAGQELRQLAGVALKLDVDNMRMVLNKAGIKEAADVASALGLSLSLQHWFKSLFGVQSWVAVLDKWKEQESYVSWNKVAEALQKRHGVDCSQIILEISGEGGFPTIAKHPTNKNTAVGKKVVFECQATGAAPLVYTWMHDGNDMPARNQRRLEFVVHQRSKGEYSCRVENEFGSSKSDPAMLTVGDFPNITSIRGEKYIKTGGTINICCTATGELPLKYSWWFSSVTPSTSSSTVLPNEDGPTLVITDAKEKDHEGFYQCHVKNSFGHVSSDFLNIKVGNPPTVEKFAIEGTTKISFIINEEVNFYCEANGTPPLHYVWLCNSDVMNVRRGNKLTIIAGEKTEGEYQCRVENLFGAESSEVLRIKVGTLPYIDVHPKILGTVEPGEFLQLKCKATGKGSLHYVWQHENQTLVNETRPDLIIKGVKESDEGAYRCCVTNAFGYAMSNPAVLNLTITQATLMKELAPHVADRWYMFAVLLNIPKPIIDKISKSFLANGNVHHSLSEVVEAWLEEISAAIPESSIKTSSLNKGKPSRYWLQVYLVVKRMGHVKFARDLGAKYIETAYTYPEQDSGNNDEEQRTKAETKPALVDTNEMQRRFTALIDKVQPLLDTPDAEPTEWFSTGESATDTSVSECKAYLHLIDFDQEDTESISDLQSLFKLLIPYMNFQRFHILEAIVHQFKSAKARRKTQKYRDLLNAYQSTVNLGRFVQAVTRQSPPENPPFMRPFSLQLESKWATCTIKDLESLLVRILPKSIGYTFMWFCKARQIPDDNSIYLDYIVPPSVLDMLQKEAERKQGILRSAGVLSIHIDGTDISSKPQLFQQQYLPQSRYIPETRTGRDKPHLFQYQYQPQMSHHSERILKKPHLFPYQYQAQRSHHLEVQIMKKKEVFKDENIETEIEVISPQTKMLALPAPEADTHNTKDTKSSDVEEQLLPKESDIEELQESLRQREEREADLQEALEIADTEIQNYRAELEAVKTELQEREERGAELKQALEKAEAEIQEYRAELENVKNELQYLKVKVAEKSKDLRNIKATVSQHSSDIDQASRDLKMKLQEEESRRSLFQETTNKRFVQVQYSIKTVKSDVESEVTSKVETHTKAQIPQLQHYMKEELEKTVQQLRDEMEKKMSQMERRMSEKHEDREERHLRRNAITFDEQHRKIEKCRDDILSLGQRLEDYRERQLWEVTRGLREYSGGGAGDTN